MRKTRIERWGLCWKFVGNCEVVDVRLLERSSRSLCFVRVLCCLCTAALLSHYRLCLENLWVQNYTAVCIYVCTTHV